MALHQTIDDIQSYNFSREQARFLEHRIFCDHLNETESRQLTPMQPVNWALHGLTEVA